ncbi:MAG: hypothetical protein JSS11_05350 [Verrucomicrobia bacterium]|nr:hypothetical protein [Verrucomicrobiota bacterium]
MAKIIGYAAAALMWTVALILWAVALWQSVDQRDWMWLGFLSLIGVFALLLTIGIFRRLASLVKDERKRGHEL